MTSHNPASVPLLSLDAVAFDSETTGLDTSKARMIQLGAVRVVHGKVDRERHFDELIDPGVPIPDESRAIHGIGDADVAGARKFAEVVVDFDNWRRDAVLIGYASGFDLAMLKREKTIAGLDWTPPRCLDVRFLVNLLKPNLPDFSLDTIASWLGVEITARHTALGDAITTAKVFVELIPRLREAGIRTLAEAERACERFAETSAQEARIGWLDPQAARRRREALARIDSFPYRHRLRELMSSPPLVVAPNLSLRETLAMLIDAKVSSLYVEPRDDSGAYGIVTERDLLRQLHREGEAAFERRLRDIAVYPLESLPEDAFVYRAIARMRRLHVRHLGVHGAGGELVGALSARDLLRQRADDAVLLGDDIDAAESAGQMAEVWGNIVLVAKALVAEDVDARDVAAVISRELCALTRRACVLAEREMDSPPPCPYAMLVLGSGGRGESLLAMDQDNAIVFADGEPDGAVDRYFGELGSRVADMLDAAGVPYCKGGIMASNPDWRHSRANWQALVETWIRRKSPEDILNCDIFFDSTCVHGDARLAGVVLDHAFAVGAQAGQFLQLMSINAAKNGPPLGLFGRFKLTDGRMDLKMGGIMPLFSTARVLAIKHGVRVSSTPARYAALVPLIANMQTTLENVSEAHRILFNAILQQQLVDIEAGIPPSNRVAPGDLSSALRDQLSWALEQVPNVSNLLGDPLAHA